MTKPKPSTTDISISTSGSEDSNSRIKLQQLEEQLRLHQEVFTHLLNTGQLPVGYSGFNQIGVGSGSGGPGSSSGAGGSPNGAAGAGVGVDLGIRSGVVNGVVSNSWSFTQGLLIGQLSVFIVIAIFIKFFVFAEQSNIVTSKAGEKTNKLKQNALEVIVKRNRKKKVRRNKEENDENAGNVNSTCGAGSENEDDDDDSFSLKISQILEKTYYDVENHAPESLDWFNVLIAQMISQLRTEALLSDNIYHSLNDFLSNLNMPDYLDSIKLTEIDVGDDFPIFSNCRINQSALGGGGLEAKIDVDLSDTLTLGIETKLILNHPMPYTAVLPVQLSVLIVRFSGCLTVSLVNTNDQEFFPNNNHNNTNTKVKSTSNSTAASPKYGEASSTPMLINSSSKHTVPGASSSDEPAGTALMFLFSPDYRLEFTVKSLIGARAKLQDVPKISSLIDSRLRSWFIERCIEPKYQVVKLPSLWPRSKNTREPIIQTSNSTDSTSRKSELPKA